MAVAPMIAAKTTLDTSPFEVLELVRYPASKVKSELLLVSSAGERDFLQEFQSFIENYMNFVELLDLYAQPLTAEEELEAEKFWANEVANDISANYDEVVWGKENLFSKFPKP